MGPGWREYKYTECGNSKLSPLPRKGKLKMDDHINLMIKAV